MTEQNIKIVTLFFKLHVSTFNDYFKIKKANVYAADWIDIQSFEDKLHR